LRGGRARKKKRGRGGGWEPAKKKKTVSRKRYVLSPDSRGENEDHGKGKGQKRIGEKGKMAGGGSRPF